MYTKTLKAALLTSARFVILGHAGEVGLMVLLLLLRCSGNTSYVCAQYQFSPMCTQDQLMSFECCVRCIRVYIVYVGTYCVNSTARCVVKLSSHYSPFACEMLVSMAYTIIV